MVVFPLILYSLLVIYEFIPLYKQKLWRDFWVNVGLGGISFTYAILLSFGADIPSPAVPIQRFIESMFGK